MSAAPSRKAGNPPIALDIRVEAGGWPARPRLEGLASRAVAAAVAAIRPELADGAELSLVFTDDTHIRALNRRFRGVDGATNVLSFPLTGAGSGRFGPLLGDIVLARETILGEAREQGLTTEAHLAHLILHGFLHILGYDHQDDAEATVMERLETAILGGLGIADPHAGPR